MKKIILLLLALVMALSLCACGDDSASTAETTKPTNPSTPAQPEASGRFLVSEIRNRFIGEEDSTTLKLTYDEASNITGLQFYENDLLTTAITCDKTLDKPLLVQYFDEDGKVSAREEWVYDEDGKLLAERTYMGDERMTQANYTYNDHGDLATKYYDNGEEDWTEIYENLYKDGKLTQTNQYIHNLLQKSWQYDGAGNLIQDTYYYEDGSTRSTKYTYGDGKLVLSVDFRNDAETSREEYAYNADGNLLSRVIWSEGTEIHRETYTYNEAGMLTEIKYTNDDGYYASTVLTYNDDGSLKALLAYDKDELELESTFTSQAAPITQAQARQYVFLYAELAQDWT